MENKKSLQDLYQEIYELLAKSEEEEEEEADDAPNFGLPEYWDDRYRQETEPYEWFISYSDISNHINYFLNDQKYNKALNLGCGNSVLFLEIQKYFNDIYNIDISGVVIDQLKEKYKDNKIQHFEKMDCTQLTYPPLYFDVVFDKATLDAISCTGDNTKIILSIIQLFNVLKVGGLFIEITCGLIMPRIQKGEKFNGKKLNFELIDKKKLSNPKEDDRIVYIFIFKKLSNEYNENGVDDACFIHKNDDDFMAKLCDDDIDKELF